MVNISSIGSKEILLEELFEKYSPLYGGFKQEIFERAFWKFRDRKKYGNPLVRVEKLSCPPLEKIAVPPAQSALEILTTEDFFDYSDVSDKSQKVWYVNYADKLLFGYYDTDMFGQDEIQTLEHPTLAAVREWLDSESDPNLKALTITDKKHTPFVMENIPKWIDIDTKKYPIYGWKFGDACAREDWDLLNKAIRVAKSERTNNIIVVAAPAGGKGRYTKAQITEALSAIIAAFGGAVLRNADSAGNKRNTVVHSGRWGAGAFGGNEELLLVCQIAGAKIAGVEKLVLHSVTESCYKNALKVAQEIEVAAFGNAAQIVDALFEKAYEWNVSDGN